MTAKFMIFDPQTPEIIWSSGNTPDEAINSLNQEMENDEKALEAGVFFAFEDEEEDGSPFTVGRKLHRRAYVYVVCVAVEEWEQYKADRKASSGIAVPARFH